MNSKILLVYEEYSEMMTAQAVLQKVGFDVLGISTEYTLSENVLSFNPDVVVAYGRSGKVTTIGCGRRLREMTRWQGKVILILPTGYKPNPEDFAKIRADMLLEAPVAPLRLMQVLGKMVGIDEAVLQERLAKHNSDVALAEGKSAVGTTGSEDKDELLLVAGQPGAEAESALISGKVLQASSADPEPEKSRFDFNIVPEADKPKSSDLGEQDLESLWNELTDHKELSITPEETAAAKRKIAPKVSFDLNDRSNEFTEKELEVVAKDLQSARNSEAERVSKYAKFTEQIKDFDPRQSLSKIASRKVQKELSKDWNHSEIESQDKLRQNFTKALFRKK